MKYPDPEDAGGRCETVPRRTDWLLALLSGGGNARPDERLDPIRIMKGLFLAQNEVSTDNIRPVDDPAFVFVPYSYGPFTPAVYGELEALEMQGLAESEAVPGKSFKLWRLTDAGWQAALEARNRLSVDTRERLDHAFSIVTTRGFNALLTYVYGRYPESAANSVHPAARSE
jgi:hypothetical protein